MQFDCLLHPIAMKRHQSFTLDIFQYISEEWAPDKRGRSSTFVTVLTLALYVFLPEASAQRVPLDVPLKMPPPAASEKNTNSAPLDRSIGTARLISGIVQDTSGAPLPGATVRLLSASEKGGTMVGTVAGIEGEFTLEIPSSYATDTLALRISLVGFITQVHKLSLLQKNDHIEVCLPIDHRPIGCPLITPIKRQEIHKTNPELVNKPAIVR
jgi:hypothetical protein